MITVIKKHIKYVVGTIRCILNSISIKGVRHIYIGKGFNCRGGVNLRLSGDVTIRPYCDIWAFGQGIEIGRRTEIGTRCRLSAVNKITIGESVLFSPNVYVTDCDHNYIDIDRPVLDQGVVEKDNTVSIGDHCYIGINSVIVGNIQVGKHCIIGANSVVTRSIPDYSVVVGAPARIIKQYSQEKKAWIKVKESDN